MEKVWVDPMSTVVEQEDASEITENDANLGQREDMGCYSLIRKDQIGDSNSNGKLPTGLVCKQRETPCPATFSSHLLQPTLIYVSGVSCGINVSGGYVLHHSGRQSVDRSNEEIKPLRSPMQSRPSYMNVCIVNA